MAGQNTSTHDTKVVKVKYKCATICAILAFACIQAGCGNAKEAESRMVTAAAIDSTIVAERERSNLWAARHTPWELTHAAIGLGMGSPMLDLDGKNRISLEQYFFDDSHHFGSPIFKLEGSDLTIRLAAFVGEMEGHDCQFLAYFALTGVALDTVIRLSGRNFEVSDLVEAAKRRFHPEAYKDVAYVLIAMSHYLSLKERWTNVYGKEMSIETLLNLAVEQDDRVGACGGTHRLFGLALALRRFEGEFVPSVSPWKEATAVLKSQLVRLRSGRDSDGSIRPSVIHMRDSDRWQDRLYSTGHSMEWAAVYLSDGELQADWVQNAVKYLIRTLNSNRGADATGSRYHALHALRLYRQRIDAWQSTETRTDGP